MMADIYINKLAAAQRQFDAAVRMFFAQENELAVLTLGNAALGICEDYSRSVIRDNWRVSRDTLLKTP